MNRTTEIYNYIVSYKLEHDGVAPSVREICAGCNVSSTSVTIYHLSKLEIAGKIKRYGEGARNIIVTGGKWTPPGVTDE